MAADDVLKRRSRGCSYVLSSVQLSPDEVLECSSRGWGKGEDERRELLESTRPGQQGAREDEIKGKHRGLGDAKDRSRGRG